MICPICLKYRTSNYCPDDGGKLILVLCDNCGKQEVTPEVRVCPGCGNHCGPQLRAAVLAERAAESAEKI